MHHPRRVLLRKALFQVHLWSGLAVGLFVTVAGLSGSAIVYREALDRMLAPGLHHTGAGTPLRADMLVASAATALPGWRVSDIFLQGTDEPWQVTLEKAGEPSRTAYVDPSSGAVLGVRGERDGLMNWLERLHIELLGGATGRYVNGAAASLLLVLCATGVVIWWPGRAHVRRALRVHWRGRWLRINRDLHTVLGFWVSLPLGLQAVSGIYLCFGLPVLGVLLAVLGSDSKEFDRLIAVPDSVKAAVGAPPAPLDAMLFGIKQRHASANEISLRLPATPQGSVEAFVRSSSDLRLGSVAVMAFDRTSGEVLKDVSSRQGSFALRTVFFLDALHFGLVGGQATKVLWVLLGLMPGLLFMTALLMWWRRKIRPRLRG